MPLTAARLADIRARAETFFTDDCTITRPSATTSTLNTTTGTTTPAAGAAKYAGACRVRPAGGDTVVDAGGEPVTLRHFDVKVPVTVIDLEVGDRVLVTTSTDDGLETVELAIVDIERGTDAPYRRLSASHNLG